MNKKLFIRADGNSTIGLGHIMRSMTIALEFRKIGYECIYLSSKPVANDIFERYGFDVIELDYDYDKKNIEEAIIVSEIVKDNYLLIDWLINENIACDREYISSLYAECDTQLLLGERFTPIREEFQAINYQINDSVQNILITTGGGDQYNFMTDFVKLIKNNYKYNNYKFTFISGACNTYIDELEEEAKNNENIVIVRNTSNISEYMKNSDIAISTGGTTVLELSVVGVPTIGFAVAQDQIDGLEMMRKYGMIQYAGNASEDGLVKRVDNILNMLLEDKELRYRLSKESSKYIDGKGAERICHRITGV